LKAMMTKGTMIATDVETIFDTLSELVTRL
jgi:hypothetical protein